MYIKDIMTMNVVTIPSNTSIADAKRIMDAHKIRRLPVVDRGKLVGLVTGRRLEQYTPSKSTSLSVWEVSYMLAKQTVKDIFFPVGLVAISLKRSIFIL
jgi:acetoin utilization protein AcuB